MSFVCTNKYNEFAARQIASSNDEAARPNPLKTNLYNFHQQKSKLIFYFLFLTEMIFFLMYSYIIAHWTLLGLLMVMITIIIIKSFSLTDWLSFRLIIPYPLKMGFYYFTPLFYINLVRVSSPHVSSLEQVHLLLFNTRIYVFTTLFL